MFKIEKEGKLCRVELAQGSVLDALCLELLSDQLLDLVNEPGTDLVFNMEEISFIDTDGLWILAEVSRQARYAGSNFMLCNVQEEVRELILYLELEGDFAIVDGQNYRQKVLLVLD